MADIPQPPSGYVHRPVPRSRREALQSVSHNRARMRAKSGLEGYLRSFFDTAGRNRDLLGTVSQESLRFISDRSVGQDPTDPLYKQMQLTRLYNEVRMEVPAILIIDSAVRWMPGGLGNHLSGARVLGSRWRGRYPIVCQVGVTISILMGDQDTADAYGDLVSILLGPLRHLAGGSEISDQTTGDPWVVRLPLTFEPSPARPVDVLNDPTRRLWAVEVELVLDYEDSLVVETEIQSADAACAAARGGVTSPSQMPGPPVIVAPSTIPLNQATPFSIQNWKTHYRVYVDRPDVAILNLPDSVIIPRDAGNFRIFVTDPGKPDMSDMSRAETIAEKSIRVTF